MVSIAREVFSVERGWGCFPGKLLCTSGYRRAQLATDVHPRYSASMISATIAFSELLKSNKSKTYPLLFWKQIQDMLHQSFPEEALQGNIQIRRGTMQADTP